jgi:hypothetical protein
MNKKFPQELTSFVSSKICKIYFLMDLTDRGPENACQNCGGLGVFHVFGATEGPFQTTTAPYRADGKVSKWHDGRWYVGNTVCFTCPDCKGLGYIDSKPMKFSHAPVTEKVEELAVEMSNRRDLE